MVYTYFNKIIFCMRCLLHSSELFFGQAIVVALPWSSQGKTVAFIAGDYSGELNTGPVAESCKL